MEAQEHDHELELTDEAMDGAMAAASAESAPPEAFYLALRNALKQLEQAPADIHVA